MDLVTCHGGSLPNSEQDTDLADPPQDIDSNRSNDDPYPSRPSSRLGFNRPISSAPSPDGPFNSEAIQWSRSLFQTVGIPDLRLSSIKNHSASKVDMSDSTCPPSPEIPKKNGSFPSSEKLPVETFPKDVSEDCVTSPVVPRKSPSVSRLCFPFVTTPSPRRNKPPPPPPPTRHKYSCFPSLMSPVPAGRPYPKHQRHIYQEHGYSQIALQHVKWFWSLREAEWENYDAYLNNVKAYEGISQDNGAILPPPIHPATPRPAQAVPSNQAIPPMTMHPRRGDISALRDPYCVHIDRCFAGLPTWTINKTLWMYDVHMATELRTKGPIPEDDSSDGESENGLETSVSTNFSDDSDTTLVESENETDTTDPPQLVISTTTTCSNTKGDSEESQDEYVDPSSTVAFATQSPSKHLNGQLVLNTMGWSRSLKAVSTKPKPRNLDNIRPPWATNWYRRWELLVDLSRQDRDRQDASFGVNTPPLEILPSAMDIAGKPFFVGRHPMDPDRASDLDARLEIAES
ncbi:hypothetical protein BDZ97DRAFT_1919657 [Flammula alnicola]|nr:hypothetical protein BDZ97DRAFT_1919657 [Flammula alnicola]